MKILLINSNGIFKKENGFFIYRATGEFLVKLKELGHHIDFFQFQLNFDDNDFLANFCAEEKNCYPFFTLHTQIENAVFNCLGMGQTEI